MTEIRHEQRKATTILVAEGDPWVLDPVAGLLRQAGYEILTATGGRDAIALFEEHASEIGAVLLDHHMPEGPGEEIFDQLQKIRPDTPVIMMSGLVSHDTIGRFMGMGVVGFLVKPFERVTLMEAVRNVIEPPAA